MKKKSILMRKVGKYIVLGLISIFVIGSAVSSLADEKGPNRISSVLSIKSKLSPFKKEKIEPFMSILPDEKIIANDKISGGLNNLISKRAIAREAGGEVTVLGTQTREISRDKIRVIFSTQPRKVNLDGIRSRGGKILKKRGNLLAAEVPVDEIENIVNNVDGIEYARFPQKFFPCAVTSEGVNLTGANILHSAGITGSGVKIAIIDVGFKGLSAAQSNGDIPASVITHDYSGRGLQTQYKHGTACAEIVHDMAPDAELHLLKISDEIDFYDPIDYCINNGIDIISFSLGTVGSGPGDGTGPICEACDQARANGILFVGAAGNSANSKDADGYPYGSHWEGTFRDSGRDYGGDNDIHQFIPGDSETWYNLIGSEPNWDDDGNSETDEVTVVLRWDDWPNANVDYDIYLLDFFTGEVVSYSNGIQDGLQPPVEIIEVDVPDSVEAVVYNLLVTKKSGEPAGKELELYLGGHCFFFRIDLDALPDLVILPPIATSPSSICEPADAQSVLAVGAIDYHNWTIGPQEDFSSQGPTNAWAGSSARIKPDICSPDRVSSYTYADEPFQFMGTSAAAPHTAGAAALILSMHPHFGPDDLQATIESNAIDMGTAGKDNLYGWGRLRVNMSLNRPPMLEWTGGPGYANDGLEPETGSSSSNFTFKINYIDPDGDAPVVHKLYLDKNGDGDYSDPGEVVDMIATGSNYTSGVIYTYTTSIPYSSGGHNCSYYFRFSDGIEFATGNITQAISVATAINKPDIFQTLSLIIDRTDWQLSEISPGTEHVTDNLNKIRATNDGDGLQTYSLQITSEGGWSASVDRDGADINKFVLSGLFTGSSEIGIDSTYFNEIGNDDVILVGSADRANSTRFGSTRISQGGFSIPSGVVRNLWLEFKAPVKDTTLATQSIELTISAEVP